MTDLRCSVVTQELGERPAGSAGGAHRYLLVELPLPWPKKIDDHPLLAEVGGRSETSTILGIASTDLEELGRHRIICYERTAPFRGFERTEALVSPDELAPIVSALLESGPSALPDDLVVEMPAATEDFLLCTHGSRDRCCGQLGTLLHLELDCALPPNVRLWRSSHTGGHRFAPTGIHFPAGTTWAYLTAELTVAIVEQSISTINLHEHYRGNVGISGRPEQIAEGLDFLDRGWRWLGQERIATTTPTMAGEHVVTVASDHHRSTTTMVEEMPVPVPVCGEELDASVKSTPHLLVTDRTVS